MWPRPYIKGARVTVSPLFPPRIFPTPKTSRILNLLPPPDGSRNVSMRAGGGAFVSCRNVRQGRKRRGAPGRDVPGGRGFPLPRVAGSAWVRHASRVTAHVPEKCVAVFGKAYAPARLRSEALPCLKEDKTASEERLGRAKAKPPYTPFQRQRFRAAFRTMLSPRRRPCGPHPPALKTLERLVFYKEPC